VATIKETGVVSDGAEIAKIILDNLKTIIAQERKILAIASEGDDEATAAMMSDYIREQEKTIWFIVSTNS
ncbi:MAG: DNA starvation/stationary phase protection protein, partial [Proteiniphilum sp.]|nr:DNA starvation/stationary phase protection protein [Proteiniphilum sp.]